MTAAPEVKAERRTYLVIFDVNIWLDVARHLGAPFDWGAFDESIAQLAKEPVPHPRDASLDSLRAIRLAMTGEHLGDPLEVWTGEHIEDLVFTKLTQETDEQVDEDRGLGWGEEDAEDFLSGFHDQVVARSNGDRPPDDGTAYGNPPLSHEDGRVMRIAVAAGRDEHGWYERFCITRDKAFRNASLPGNVSVLYPWEWVEKIRSERRLAMVAKMRGGS